MNEFDRITIYSQTEQPDDDPEDGIIIAMGTIKDDKMLRCWVTEDFRPSCDQKEIDALGVSRVSRGNLTSYDVTHESFETLLVMLDFLVNGGDYIEIDPMRFSIVRTDVKEDSNGKD
jgi:hypothetical protein